jgi:hypothetical protein
MCFVIAFLALVATGCSTVSESLRDTTFYKRDISFRVNGVTYKGAAVVPEAPRYVIEGEVRGGFDFLIVRSCHREYTAENEGDHFKYVYVPRPGLEDNRACPIDVRGAERVKGRHSFGLVDFQNKRDVLEADLECNGEKTVFPGTSACQSPMGLIQKIRFPVPVIAQGESLEVTAGSDACPMTEPKDRLTYEFKTPYKRCQYVFMEVSAPHRTHRMTTLGYEQSVIREF